MIYKKIYTDYYEKLVNLPMDDTTFIAKLLAQNLLPGDMENKIEVQAAPINKASYFLNHMIKPSIDLDNGDCFDKLLSVMEHCGYDHIKHLALEIKSVIKGGENAYNQVDSRASTSTKVSTMYSVNVKCPKCGKSATSGKVKDRKKITYGHPYYYCTAHDFIEWKNTAHVNCDCDLKAKKNVTKKRGPNYGKWFYTCKIDRCDYFVWSAEVESRYGRKISGLRGYKYPYIRRRKALSVRQYTA